MIYIEYQGGPYDGHWSILVPILNKEIDTSFKYISNCGNYYYQYNKTKKYNKSGYIIYDYVGKFSYKINSDECIRLCPI